MVEPTLMREYFVDVYRALPLAGTDAALRQKSQLCSARGQLSAGSRGVEKLECHGIAGRDIPSCELLFEKPVSLDASPRREPCTRVR